MNAHLRALLPLLAVLIIGGGGTVLLAHTRPATPPSVPPTTTPTPVSVAPTTAPTPVAVDPTGTPTFTQTPSFSSLSATPTPTATATPTAGVGAPLALSLGEKLGARPVVDCVNAWTAGKVVKFAALLSKLPKDVRCVRFGEAATTDPDVVDAAVASIVGAGLRPGLVLNVSNDTITTTNWADYGRLVEALLTRLHARYGEQVASWPLEGGWETRPAYLLSQYEADALAVGRVEAATRLRFKLCGPGAIRWGFGDVDRWLQYVSKGGRADCLSLHWYEYGGPSPRGASRFTLNETLATVTGLQSKWDTNLPIHVTEWNLDGLALDQHLTDEQGAVWTVRTLAGDAARGVDSWAFSALVGNWFTQPGGHLGLYTNEPPGIPYPVKGALDLWSELGPELYSANIPGDPIIPLEQKVQLGVVSDGQGRWLLWSDHVPATGEMITVTVPCTGPLRQARVDAGTGNAAAVYARTKRLGDLAARASPWVDESGAVLPGVACEGGRAVVRVPGSGLVFLGSG